jgi:hypothetical protein
MIKLLLAARMCFETSATRRLSRARSEDQDFVESREVDGWSDLPLLKQTKLLLSDLAHVTDQDRLRKLLAEPGRIHRIPDVHGVVRPVELDRGPVSTDVP